MIDARPDTIPEWLTHWARAQPDSTWLRDRTSDAFNEWTWQQANEEVRAVAAALEAASDGARQHCAILSRNRAHWVLADLAVIASGNVTVPMFTTQPADTARYVLEFAEVTTLFLGEADNWEAVRSVVPDNVSIVTLPGVEIADPHLRWADICRQHAGGDRRREGRHDDLVSIVFTSGTTGDPKGVMHSHDSMLLPMHRCCGAFQTRENPRFLSYLPLSHIAERQAVLMQSLIHGGTITFNESLPQLLRDIVEVQPTFFFGAPRVWEQLQQYVIDQFGSQQALDRALDEDEPNTSDRVRRMVGLTDADYLLTGAAPAYAPLIEWWQRMGLSLMDGYGQTEAMGLIGNTAKAHRVGSIGKVIEGVEVRIGDNEELVCRAPGLALGYYRRPVETAETFADGWIHTGDTVRVDADGFFYITGRVKDYFKTIHGKYVSPVPIEGELARCELIDQLCLLGRGYSKTVVVCVLTEAARKLERGQVEHALGAHANAVNATIERHARIGAIIVASNAWTIANSMLTPTMKLRRQMVEKHFDGAAEALARTAASEGKMLFHWE
ncbi:MAG: AMP-binding protein [Steroidobacteraceae bacterium]